MSRLPIFILIIFITSCDESGVAVTRLITKDTTINLIDSLGRISLQPPRLSDTFFTWIRQNDCGKPCQEGKYRFQQKCSPIFKESGFVWVGQPEDSVNQLTISHSRDVYMRNNDDSFALKQYAHFKENLLADPTTCLIVFDTLQKISDRYYAIFEVIDFNKQKSVYIRRLIAITSISGNEVRFRYDLLTRKQDTTLENFFESSVSNLRTVRIKDNG